jgi:hypothetical protein
MRLPGWLLRMIGMTVESDLETWTVNVHETTKSAESAGGERKLVWLQVPASLAKRSLREGRGTSPVRESCPGHTWKKAGARR